MSKDPGERSGLGAEACVVNRAPSVESARLGPAPSVRERGPAPSDASRGLLDEPPCVVIVDTDEQLRSSVCRVLDSHCDTHPVEPGGAVDVLRELTLVDVALVDCDVPPSAQAPIFRELARWPGVVCVLMSANAQKVDQLRALGVFAPLVLDKPLQPEALDALCSATLELCALS